jgi:hypothetical protein
MYLTFAGWTRRFSISLAVERAAHNAFVSRKSIRFGTREPETQLDDGDLTF